jgi:hypothetical protein
MNESGLKFFILYYHNNLNKSVYYSMLISTLILMIFMISEIP